ncbi:MAG: hypothetical protein KIT27_12015 [Legionellales bacterium]|nr:hypothetical protein [Legionellales bacterium]
MNIRSLIAFIFLCALSSVFADAVSTLKLPPGWVMTQQNNNDRIRHMTFAPNPNPEKLSLNIINVLKPTPDAFNAFIENSKKAHHDSCQIKDLNMVIKSITQPQKMFYMSCRSPQRDSIILNIDADAKNMYVYIYSVADKKFSKENLKHAAELLNTVRVCDTTKDDPTSSKCLP